jgi:hypothetical protein
MMLILLAAIDEGLAAAFIGHPDQEQFLRGLLGLPEDVVPIGVALVGRPAADPLAERGTSRLSEARRPIGEVVRWNGW